MPRPSTRIAATLVAASALGATAAPAASADRLQMPFACGTTVLGQARADHLPAAAIDLNGLGGGDTDLGMPVVAAGSGRVLVSTYYTSNGYGNAIEIGHGKGQQSFYAHLRDRLVKVGDRVRRGQVIGHVGKTSAKYTFTAHLHYEERRDHHAVRAFFNGRLAEPDLHMEVARKMKSRNCGTAPAPAPAPAPGPAPAPAPQPDTPDRGIGVPLPAIAKRFAATIRTDNGMLVKARRGPRTTAAEVRSFKGGTRVQIVCQTRGEQVTGKFGTSRLWDLIDLGGGRGAYVTDTYVYTGSDGRVAPDCP